MNNVFAGRGNAVVALRDATFAECGFNVGNVKEITLQDTVKRNWQPQRTLNGMTGFVKDKGYWFIPKVDMDLTAFLAPPTTGGDGGADFMSEIFIDPNA